MKPMSVRPTAVAGMFYPADPQRLRDEVETCLAQANTAPAAGEPLGILCPHAGYVYSGTCAAHGFARIRGAAPSRVVLLGRSHRMLFDGAAFYAKGAFDTPLGSMPIDEPFAAQLVERFGQGPVEAHLPEHSLEVELPFLQVVLGDVPIVPILFGADCAPWHADFGRTLAAMLDEHDLVLASTDLSHYLPEEEANRIDHATLQGVLEQDCDQMPQAFREGRYSMCGAPAVLAAMACAKARGAQDWRLLDYRTSAKASGDRSRVVGYGALSMERAA